MDEYTTLFLRHFLTINIKIMKALFFRKL